MPPIPANQYIATVLDIRGTHGSGKSYLVHMLLSIRRNEPILEDGKHLGYYLPGIDAAVLGKYGNKCGGCDGIKNPDEVCRRVRMFARKYSVVILEGILVAHTFKRYNDLAQEIGDYRFLFLDTPLDACIERVKLRRAEVGNAKPFNPRNVQHDHKQIWTNCRAKLVDAGRRVVVLEHGDAWRQFAGNLRDASGIDKE